MDNRRKTRRRQRPFEQKYEIIKEILEEGRHKKEIAEEYQVHINTLRNWVRAYKKEGKEGLRNLNHEKRGNKIPGIMDEKTKEEFKRLREIEKKYNEQQQEIEILKKFQAFLKESENEKHTKQ